MAMMDLVVRGVSGLVRLRRSRRGAMRPNWDERYETLASVLHHYGTRSGSLPVSWQRGIAERFVGGGPAPGGIEPEADHGAGMPGAWFRVAGAARDRVLLYLHGGGYTIGSIRTHRHLIARLCLASHTDAFAVEYRLAPEHPHPAAVDDAMCAYRHLLRCGYDADAIVVGGESAGGGLTLALMLAARDEGLDLPAGAFLISPWVDLDMTGNTLETNARYDYVSRASLERFASHFVRADQRRDPLASPLHAELTGLPPLLIQAGGAETLLDDARRLAERARGAGVPVELEVWDDMIHAWHAFAHVVPQGGEAIDRIGVFVRERLSSRDAGHAATLS